MATIDELHAQGHLLIRLPQWRLGYAELYEDPESGRLGPWVKVYDVGTGIGGGEPLTVAIWDCDKRADWVPHNAATGEGSRGGPESSAPDQA